MAFGHKTGGRDFTSNTPGPGRPKGSRNKVPPTVQASVRSVMADIVANEPTLIRDCIVKGLRAAPPRSFPYLQLAAAYIDGRPAESLRVTHFERLTDDDLVLLETLLARAAGEDGEVSRNPFFNRPVPRASLDALRLDPARTDDREE